ncbi:riboflavin synthase, alpha subunit [Denitrovibrio acetiphilus DSM 12809]|jgi:riboflavin synthase|uniref:Riboflavin synthase n=1 Tax=Denitrovibrio acetiphilus (strain DSM 12809 / NBRC 114555 / N2460) TaxID=522772 RepID=D4H7U7_DENA2|nr:riboflavin synthase [Denitrovibrio acetiphilus]ADD68096.1 riboflavin synthase, alpha subunit [Denitrovibrio acetiphilus DSM 12809]
MFTGIIEEVGSVSSIDRKGDFAVLKIKCSKVLESTQIGDSIAVNGVCLTVTSMGTDTFCADISYETIKKSTFADITNGSGVNLERALTLSTRLGGHLVSGHVDAVGTIEKFTRNQSAYILTIRYPDDIDKYLASKGSVCVDGISLTTARCSNGTFEVAVIPHTYEGTSLKGKRQGSKVNLEVDMISRYLEKLLKSLEKTDTLMDNLSGLIGQEDY